MCEHGTDREIVIERRLVVDACIADTIVALNRAGVYTAGCCCGHGTEPSTALIVLSSASRARALGYEVRGAGQYCEITIAPGGAERLAGAALASADSSFDDVVRRAVKNDPIAFAAFHLGRRVERDRADHLRRELDTVAALLPDALAAAAGSGTEGSHG